MHAQTLHTGSWHMAQPLIPIPPPPPQKTFTSAAQGREREWLFAEAEGQWEVARQCGARRLVLVALGRGHAFASLAAVQAELSPLVSPFPSAGRHAGHFCSMFVPAVKICAMMTYTCIKIRWKGACRDKETGYP